MNEFKDNLINKIKTGDIAMRPRWHFVLKTFLLLVSIVLAALIAVYLLSFVLFTLRQSGLVFAPQFGWHGYMMFVVSSPWLLIGILGIFLLLLYVLVSQYSFSYQKPFVYSIVGVVLSVIAVSSLIQYVGFHDQIRSFSERHNIPGLAPLYRDIPDRRPPGVVTGSVVAVSETELTILTETNEEITVGIDKETRVAPGTALAVGAEVMIFGDQKGDIFTAFGIRSADGEAFGPRPRKHLRGGLDMTTQPPF